jgi:hypothetical protein
MRERTLVRFRQRFETASIHGYIHGVGAKFVLVAIVNDRVWLEGFECFRIKDVRGIKPDPYRKFIERALKLRGERKPKRPRIKMGSIGEIIVSASRLFPLVTIHQEETRPDVCWIGRVLGVDSGRVRMLDIEPGAVWASEPSSYRLAEITQVSFGADYEGALYLVGGEPKKSRFPSGRG